VVRGVVDYCEDAGKNDTWHHYSSLAAAAYVRALLEQCVPLGPAKAAAPPPPAHRRSWRGWLPAVPLAAAGGVAAMLAASAAPASAVLVSAALVLGLIPGLAGLRRRRAGGSARRPEERLRRAVRDQWIAEANELGLGDPRRLTMELRSTAPAGPAAVNGAGLARLWQESGWLVLLGEPGAGKSELLIAMLVEMLRAREPTGQVPVLIPIASWEAHRDGLYDWLERWLIANYPFLAEPGDEDGPSLARGLLDDDRIAFVLDGFDELPLDLRHVALTKMAAEARRPRRLLLAGRTRAYREATSMPRRARAGLPAAEVVTVSPLAPAEVVEYLRNGAATPAAWTPLAEAMAADEDLRRTFSTPLMVMLADTTYNPVAAGPGPPIAHLVAMPPGDLRQFLFRRFLPVKYGDRAEQARRWLRQLVSSPATAGSAADIAWWRLARRPLGRPVAARILGGSAMVLWTAVSAGLLNTWALGSEVRGLTIALRIGIAAGLCYAATTLLSRDGRAAFVASLGAYLVGVVSGVYELALVAGFAAAFSWRPLTLVRTGPRYAAGIGLAAALAVAPVRLAEHLHLLSLEPTLTEGFAAGFSDGAVSGWDQDLNGAVATATVVALIVALGMRFAPGPPVSWPSARVAAPACGLVVAAGTAFADSYRPLLSHGYLLAPSEGLLVAVAVWFTLTVVADGVRTRVRPLPAAAAAAVVTAVVSGIGNAAKADLDGGWWRGPADAIAVGVVVWSVLRSRTPAAPASPRQRAVALILGVGTGGLAAVCYAMALGRDADGTFSARTGYALMYGTTVAVIVLSRPWWPAWYRAAGRAATGGPVPFLALGVFAAVAAGLIAGMAYGLFSGLVAGLAGKVATELAQRSTPALTWRPSYPGIVGGSLLGGTVAAAASVAGLDPRYLPLFGLSTGLAAALAFGSRGQADPDAAMSPRRLLGLDRTVLLICTIGVAATVGLAVGVRTTAAGETPAAAAIAALATAGTYGLTAGLTVAAAQSRSGAYAAAVAVHAARGNLPPRPMRFLEDAHRRGVLRQYGPVYRLRHQDLAPYLQEALRPAGTRPASPPGRPGPAGSPPTGPASGPA